MPSLPIDMTGVFMNLIAEVLIVIVAALHVFFLVLEMFMWESERAMKAFGSTPEFAKQTKVLAANQGLYNGFLAAGLLWGLLLSDNGFGVKVFFLTCVIVAGVYGSITATRRILFIQALPAALALLFVFLSR
jgi:putative membrane protein